MNEKIEVTQEEIEVVDNVLRRFMRNWGHHEEWNRDDVRQELLLFWVKKKQRGWKRPEKWKGAMGYCLNMYLIDLLRKEYGRVTDKAGSDMEPEVDEMHETGQ